MTHEQALKVIEQGVHADSADIHAAFEVFNAELGDIIERRKMRAAADAEDTARWYTLSGYTKRILQQMDDILTLDALRDQKADAP